MRIERDPYKVARWLAEHGLIKNNVDKCEMRGWYNCWGLTAYLVGWVGRAFWMDNFEMESLLEHRSKPVATPQPGDIAVFRFDPDGAIQHTAVVCRVPVRENPILIEKYGGNEMAVHSLKETYSRAGSIYGKVQEYRRPIER